MQQQPDKHVAAKSPEHWPALDGLRTLAVVAVLLNHGTYGLFPAGFLGVDLFFVLSGFLVTHLLLKERARTGRIDYRHFLYRRTLRLLPALVATVLLCGTLWKVGEVQVQAWSWSRAALATLAGVANFFTPHMNKLEHAWSLSLEAQFYFLWPLVLTVVLRKGTRQNAWRIMGGIVLLCLLLRMSLYLSGVNPSAILFSSPFCRADALLLGAMVAFLKPEGARRQVRKWSVLRAPVFLIGAVSPFLHSFDMMAPYLYLGGFSLFAALYACMVLLAVYSTSDNLEMRVLGSGLCRWVAARSYGIYLYHYPIFMAMEAWRESGNKGNLVLVSLLRILVSLLAAEASYRWIELPFLRLREKTPVLSASTKR